MAVHFTSFSDASSSTSNTAATTNNQTTVQQAVNVTGNKALKASDISIPGFQMQPLRFAKNVISRHQPLSGTQKAHFASVCQKMKKQFADHFPDFIQTIARYETIILPYGTFREGLCFYLNTLIQKVEEEVKDFLPEEKKRTHFDMMRLISTQLIIELFEYGNNIAPEHNYSFFTEKRTLDDLRRNALPHIQSFKKYAAVSYEGLKHCHSTTHAKIPLHSWLEIKAKGAAKLLKTIDILNALIYTDHDIDIFTYPSRLALPTNHICEEIPQHIFQAIKILQIVTSTSFQELVLSKSAGRIDLQLAESDKPLLMNLNKGLRNAQASFEEIFKARKVSRDKIEENQLDSLFTALTTHSPSAHVEVGQGEAEFVDIQQQIGTGRISLIDMTTMKFHRTIKYYQTMTNMYLSQTYLSSRTHCTRECTLLNKVLRNYSYLMRSLADPSLFEELKISEAKIKEISPANTSKETEALIKKFKELYDLVYESTQLHVTRIVKKLELGIIDHLMGQIETLKKSPHSDPHLHFEIFDTINTHLILDLQTCSAYFSEYALIYDQQWKEVSSSDLAKHPAFTLMDENLRSLAGWMVCCIAGSDQTLSEAVSFCIDPELSADSNEFKNLQSLFDHENFHLDPLFGAKKKKKKKKKKNSAPAPEVASPQSVQAQVKPQVPAVVVPTPVEKILPKAPILIEKPREPEKKETKLIVPHTNSLPLLEVPQLSSQDLKRKNFMKRLEVLGGYLVRQNSHQMMDHPGLASPLAVPAHKELNKGLAYSLLKKFLAAQQAALIGKKINYGK